MFVSSASLEPIHCWKSLHLNTSLSLIFYYTVHALKGLYLYACTDLRVVDSITPSGKLKQFLIVIK